MAKKENMNLDPDDKIIIQEKEIYKEEELNNLTTKRLIEICNNIYNITVPDDYEDYEIIELIMKCQQEYYKPENKRGFKLFSKSDRKKIEPKHKGPIEPKFKSKYDNRPDLLEDDLKESFADSTTYSLFMSHKIMLVILGVVAYSLFGLAYWQYTTGEKIWAFLYSGFFNLFFAFFFFINFKPNWYYIMKKLMRNFGQVIVIQRDKRIFHKFLDLKKYPLKMNKKPYFPDSQNLLLDAGMPTYVFIQDNPGSVSFEHVRELVKRGGSLYVDTMLNADLIDRVMSSVEEVSDKKKTVDIAKDLWAKAKWYVIVTAVCSAIAALTCYTTYDMFMTAFPDGRITIQGLSDMAMSQLP